MKFRNTIFVCASLISSLATSTLLADVPSFNPRPRMLGMGGTGVAISGSRESAMMNPAALSDVTSSKFESLPILLEVPFDLGIVSDFLDFKDVTDDETSTDAEKRAAFQTFSESIASIATATRINLYPSWTKNDLHVGLLADMYVNPRFRIGGVTSDQVVELGGSNGTTGLVVGGSRSFLQNRLRVGATIKALYRVDLTAEQEVSVYDLLIGQDTSSTVDQIFGDPVADRRGFGFGLDLGARYDLPFLEDVLRPSVGMTWQDIGSTRFVGNKDSRPNSIPQSVSLGAAIHPDWKLLRNTIALDLRNIQESQEFMNKLHLGIETVVWDVLAFRGGFAQGYFSTGMSLLTWIFEAEVFFAAREAGKKANIQAIKTLGLKVSLGF
jgi:hypothetical protein